MTTTADSASEVAVSLEIGSKRVFASALDWPGWCRSGRDEALALDALSSFAARYAVVAAAAGIPFAATGINLRVVERLPGSATTDFGAPAAIAAHDSENMTPDEAERLAALVDSAWAYLDRVVATAPAELRKGPRGGGRDRDRVFAHVVEAEAAYARKLGIRHAGPLAGDPETIASPRAAVLEALRATTASTSVAERGWPPRYAARRIAWHVLDHAWEIEDRSV